MSKIVVIISLLCGAVLQAQAAAPASEYWQRDAALTAIGSVAIEQAAREVGDVATLANAASTLQRLQALETRADWPLPAREAALHRFTRSLASLPRDAVAVEVMQHLLAYRARAMVPHEEHIDAWVPLFNIRAAARGVENAWAREAATSLAVSKLLYDPVALVDLFEQSPGGAQRHGYLDAVEIADIAAVIGVQDEVLHRLATQPELSPLLASTAIITRDFAAMRELLIHGHGAGLATALARFTHDLGTDELAGLYEFAVFEAPTPNASLAIATWWPRLRHDANTREIMLGLLGDAELGSTAALALSRQPDVAIIKALSDTAAGDTQAARQARRALELNRAQLHAGGLQ
ncbi:MAG: hypothetical protein PVF46_09645 [Lysobacterales bacterium]|jgi:hypothetical protein